MNKWHAIQAMGSRLRSAHRAPFAVLLTGAFVVSITLATYSVGLLDGRSIWFLGGLDRFLHTLLGLVLTVILGVASTRVRAHRPRFAAVIVASLATGWLGFIAGNVVARFEGPSVGYTGSARIGAGPDHRSIDIVCWSVTGDPADLSGFSAGSFNLGLKTTDSRTPNVGVAGDISIGGRHVAFLDVVEVAANGLRGQATISSLIYSASGGLGAPAEVSIEWTCDRAT